MNPVKKSKNDMKKLLCLIIIMLLSFSSCKTISTLNPMEWTLSNKVVYWIEFENMMDDVYKKQGESFCLSPELFMDCNRGDSDCHYMTSPTNVYSTAIQELDEYRMLYKCYNLKIVKYRGLKYIETLDTVYKSKDCNKSINEAPRT